VTGTCYIIATPIGNLSDISRRALDTLASVDIIAAEDTRTSGILLNKYGINTKKISYHAQNEQRRIPELVAMLQAGQNIAVISDAGTPGISDPSNRLVSACVAEAIRVVSIPGPSALTTALAAAGLPTDRFWFEGFLPLKKGRQKRLTFLAEMEATVVIYESPHRIHKCMQQIVEFFGPDRYCVIARELTKIHEEYIRGSALMLAGLTESRKLKGEMVVMVAASSFKTGQENA
jgi:16S rRNA (cytidine1402-2'-O)-methyltransferase